MQLSVSTNFDNDFLHKVNEFKVASIYGKEARDIFGGGRPSTMLPDITREHINDHIKLTHSLGMEFDYLLNTTCMNNLEFTKDKNNIIKEIQWLKSMKVDRITIALPFLINIIKKHAPEIKIGLSTYAHADTLEKASKYEQMGVDEITLPEGLNRNFKLLKLLRKNLKCDLRLIATNTCLLDCPFRIYHMNSVSHASQINHVSEGFYLSYSMLRCTETMLNNPVEIIKSPWIRPEDLHFYEEIGINRFKITERSKKTAALINIVKAYNERKFDGNLAKLLNFRIKTEYIPPNFGVLAESGMKDSEIIQESFNLLFSQKININNRKLDGFLDYFVKMEQDCRNTLCGNTCTHCNKYADNVLTIDKEYDKDLPEKFKIFFDKLADIQKE